MNDVELLGKSIINMNKQTKLFLHKSDIQDENINYIDDFEGILIREGNKVIFNARIELKNMNNETITIVILKKIPKGFRLDTMYNNTVWNIPITVGRNQDPKLFFTTAFAERNVSEGNKIVFYGNRNGNFYLQGNWYTDDN